MCLKKDSGLKSHFFKAHDSISRVLIKIKYVFNLNTAHVNKFIIFIWYNYKILYYLNTHNAFFKKIRYVLIYSMSLFDPLWDLREKTGFKGNTTMALEAIFFLSTCRYYPGFTVYS